MNRALILAYGVFCYLVFFVTFCYTIGFVLDAVVPKTIDSPETSTTFWPALLINIGLLTLFAVQHTIMARPWFKQWWTRIIPKPMERSTFVLAASLVLILLFWLWQPMTGTVWQAEMTWLRGVLYGLSLAGFGIVLYSSFLIDHFDLFGLRQVILHLRRKEYTHHPFIERSLYRIVRHPLMVGFLIAFWSAPTMTEGHLLFSIMTTAYILFGTFVEEGDLIRSLGDDYRRYRKRTSRFIPIPKRAQQTRQHDTTTHE